MQLIKEKIRNNNPKLFSLLKQVKNIFTNTKNRRSFNWNNVRTTEPISRKFGFDRGKPIDRYYIEKFISLNSKYICGDVVEISESKYTTLFGKNILSSSVIGIDNTQNDRNIYTDLTDSNSVKKETYDCFICTQTINFIYEYDIAIKNIFDSLKSGGTLLCTVAGLCQISRYDMDKWGDYWRFTEMSVHKMFSKHFGAENIKVECYGNSLTAISIIKGLASDDLNENELLYKDDDYAIIITVVAHKKLQ